MSIIAVTVSVPLTLTLLALTAGDEPRGGGQVERLTQGQGGMVDIPPGHYRPFFKRADGVTDIAVAAFGIRRGPVTKREYLEFVREHSNWRKGRVPALLAESNYLLDWASELDPGADLDAPVTYVSWFAARAYCAEHARLPTVAEWERFAGESRSNKGLASSTENPFEFAMGRAALDLRNLPLLFGNIWEWTEDFNSSPALQSSLRSDAEVPRFCGDGARSNDANDYAAFLRYSLRSSLKANYTLKNLGFRCAR